MFRFGLDFSGSVIFSRVYEVLDFMLEADTNICGMVSNLVELTVVVWVKTRYV